MSRSTAASWINPHEARTVDLPANNEASIDLTGAAPNIPNYLNELGAKADIAQGIADYITRYDASASPHSMKIVPLFSLQFD